MKINMATNKLSQGQAHGTRAQLDSLQRAGQGMAGMTLALTPQPISPIDSIV